jgi:hypothetical protein
MAVTTESAVRDLIDRMEIADLVTRLGMALDEGRFDEMAELLVEDATARTPGGRAEGRAAVVAQARKNHRADLAIQHVISDVLVDLDGDRAEVRANLVVSFALAVEVEAPAVAPPVTYTLGEVYRFEVVRTGGGWRFARVETVPVWMSGERPPT